MREAGEWVAALLGAAWAVAWLVWSHRRRGRRTRHEFERDLRRWRRVKHVYRALLYYPPEVLPGPARPQAYDAAEVRHDGPRAGEGGGPRDL